MSTCRSEWLILGRVTEDREDFSAISERRMQTADFFYMVFCLVSNVLTLNVTDTTVLDSCRLFITPITFIPRVVKQQIGARKAQKLSWVWGRWQGVPSTLKVTILVLLYVPVHYCYSYGRVCI